MKKKTTKKITHNKWKIVAIISLVINALVTLLLVVGLVTPKAKYVSVNAQSDDATAYIYKNSNDIKPTYNIWADLSQECTGLPGVGVYSSTHSIMFNFDEFPRSYLDTTDYLDRAYAIVFTFSPSVQDESSSAWLLRYITFYPVSPSNSSYFVFSSSWEDAWISYTNTYRDLGYNSPYCYLPSNMDSRVKAILDRYFVCLGDNSVIENFLINDSFNPNKYMSLTMDSIGLLYEAPSDLGGLVTWSAPQYKGLVNGSKTSTLGFLEIPLFFTSNNENFLGIRLYYDVVQSYVGKDDQVHYIEYGNDPIPLKYHYTFVYMSYYYEPTTYIGSVPYNIREKVVCAVPVYTQTTSYIQYDTWYRNFTYEPFKVYNWLSDEYKKICVYGASQEQLNSVGISYPLNVRSLAINNLTIKEILLYDMSINPDNINTGGGNIGNVFSIIRLAFDSLTGILAISIVPGISIGIMLFLPLVLTIIIVIIKLVKR